MRLPKLLRRIRPSRPTADENREALERGRRLAQEALPINGSVAIHIMQAGWTIHKGDFVVATPRGLIRELSSRLRSTGLPFGLALESGYRGDLVNVAARGVYAVGPELPK